MASAARNLCDLCNRPLEPQAFYIVRIQVYADPSMPSTTTEELEELDPQATMAELLAEMSEMTEQELQNDVARTFEYHLCRPCQQRFLLNPLGKPRAPGPGDN